MTSTSVPALSTEARLPADVRDALRDALGPDEVIEWLERPSRLRQVRGSVPAAWIGVGLVALSGVFALLPKRGAVFPALVTLILGLIVAAHPLRAYRHAARVVHVITDRRVFVIEPSDGTVPIFRRHELDTRIFSLAELSTMEVRRNSDGSGDVVLAKDQEARGSDEPITLERGMFYVRDVDDLARRLRSFIERARGNADARHA